MLLILRRNPSSPVPKMFSSGILVAETTVSVYENMTREELLRALDMFAKSWLAHDGCWFLAAEDKLGIEKAIELDTESWRRFAVAEARRIMNTFGVPANGGLQALEYTLSLRMYSAINKQHSEWSEDRKHLMFYMDVCRVQETRRSKGLPDFPCKSVGMVEFDVFARTLDPRIRTECLRCPPDAPKGMYCGWQFTVEDSNA